jgi:hypothetical protein
MILTNGGLMLVGSIQLDQPMVICFWVRYLVSTL